MKFRDGFTLVELLIVLAIIGIFFSMICQPYFEMRTFNKFSNTKATYWDAVFSQLRIEANRANTLTE